MTINSRQFLSSHWNLTIFSLYDINGNILNLHKTFQPKPKYVYGIIKLGLLVWSLHVLIQSIMDYNNNYNNNNDESKVLWLGYLTNWQQVFSLGYLLGSNILFFFIPIRNNDNHNISRRRSSDIDDDDHDDDKKASILIRIVWTLYVEAIFFGLIASILFWIIIYKPSNNNGVLSYINIMSHGITFLLVVIDGMIIHRIPIRLKQILLFQITSILYLIWIIIHGFTFDDTLYNVIDWKNKTGPTALLSLMLVFVVVPVLFIIVWLLCNTFLKSRYYYDNDVDNDNHDEDVNDTR